MSEVNFTGPMEQAFLEFDRKNPTVYPRIHRIAVNLRYNKGILKFGMQRILEELRYEVASTDGDHFKLNNNWAAFYARKLVHDYPEFDGVLVMRQRKAA